MGGLHQQSVSSQTGAAVVSPPLSCRFRRLHLPSARSQKRLQCKAFGHSGLTLSSRTEANEAVRVVAVLSGAEG